MISDDVPGTDSGSPNQPALHPTNRALLDYWYSKQNGCVAPREASIDPTEIQSLLPDLIIYERIEPDHFQVRVVGRRVVSRIGVDPTGGNIFELFSERFKSGVMAAMNRILDEPCAQVTTVRDRFPSGRKGLVEVLRLPLTDDGGRPRYIISSTAELQPLDDETSREMPELIAEPVANRFLALEAPQSA